MGSFVALHVENCDEQRLVRAIGAWLAPLGFGETERFDEVPDALRTFRFRSADAVGVERMNDSWHIILVNSFVLGPVSVDALAVRSLAERLGNRAVLFVAQTTSDAYELAVFEKAECIRRVVCSDGQLLASLGPPLPSERDGAFFSKPSLDDEGSPSEMEDATSICAAMGCELWRTPPIKGPGYYWRRRGFVSRLFGR